MPAHTINLTMGVREWALLIALSLLWGGSFFFAEVALFELGPFTLVFGRVFVAAAALILLIHATGGRLPRGLSVWLAFAVMGAVNNVIPFSLIFWGQTHITSGLASILNATTPLFTVILAHFLTADERLSAGRMIGVGLGIVGVAVIIGLDVIAGLGTAVLAQTAVVGGAVSYAFAGIYGKRLLEHPPLTLAAGQLCMSSILILPVALIVERPWTLAQVPNLVTWGAVLATGLFSTALAYVIYFRLLSSSGATNLLLVTFLIPISALGLGILFLGEGILPRQLAGMAMIGLGLAAIDGRPFQQIRQTFQASRRQP
jgi:drug/metabolite transporter (DMT)-like permease